MQTLPQAKEYHRIKNRLFVINLILTLCILLIIILSGFSTRLKTNLGQISSNPLILNGLYITALSFLFYLAGFPLDFYEGFILEHRFQLSRQSLGGYLKDCLKKSLISLPIALIAIEFLYLFLSRFPEIWWVLAASGWFFLTVVLAKITPSLLLPLFYKYLPLKDRALRDKIIAMFSQAETKLKDVYMIDFYSKTKKLNAAVAGFGKSRRVILTDNLLAELSHDEILSIVAHELGHYKNRDTIKIVTFSALVTGILFYASDYVLKSTFPFFGYARISDIAGFPLFALTMFIFGILVLPVQNGFIRRLETRADLYSLSLMKMPDVFISMMEKLAQKNLAEVAPSRFIEIMLYDHPPIAKRIALAKGFKTASP
jgi:STE24 endopeptidase